MSADGTVRRVDPDPWANRSVGMLCHTCIWFMRKGDDGSAIGRCRRRAPTMNGYPVVMINDWCGDHKLNENHALNRDIKR